MPLGQGKQRKTPVAMEYMAEASYAPLVSLRLDDWKYNRCRLDPDQLFNLNDDPNELTNLADDPVYVDTLAKFRAMADARWDLEQLDQDIRKSQARRWVVYEALRNGDYFPWDHQPLQKASERYMRNHMDLNIVEETKRYPPGD